MRKLALSLVLAVALAGCGDDGSSGETGGDCEGQIITCRIGQLTATQLSDACDLVLASIDDPAGTEYKCESGTAADLFLTVNTKEQCVQSQPPTSCPVTVQHMIDCYKAAKEDACAAFDGGACAPIFENASSCGG
jgi:hypothetical protein